MSPFAVWCCWRWCRGMHSLHGKQQGVQGSASLSGWVEQSQAKDVCFSKPLNRQSRHAACCVHHTPALASPQPCAQARSAPASHGS